MLAAHKARHGGRTKRSGGRKGRTRYLGFIAQAVSEDSSFGVSSCHGGVFLGLGVGQAQTMRLFFPGQAFSNLHGVVVEALQTEV